MGAFSVERVANLFSGASRAALAKLFSMFLPIDCYELTNPAAAGAADLEAAVASQVAPRTVTTFLAGGVAKLAAFPRNISFTTAGGTPADAPATATITGTDYDGKVQTEVVNVAQTATIANGVKAFRTITKVEYSAGDGTGATVSIGVGLLFGLPFKPKLRTGAVALVRELVNGAPPGTAGTFADPTASPPYGTYSPNTAPNGTNDYAFYVERDPSGLGI